VKFAEKEAIPKKGDEKALREGLLQNCNKNMNTRYTRMHGICPTKI
jgi:hypothetical protein